MERLGLKVSLLDLQYRMHPQIAAFPSLQFYGGKVGSVPTPQDRPVVPGLTWPSSDIPIAFVEISGLETREPDGNSLYNKEEAKIAIGIVKKLLKSGGLAGPGDIGVISPHLPFQVCRLQEEYGVIGKPKRNYLDLTEEDLMNELEIRSVDGFQGREKGGYRFVYRQKQLLQRHWFKNKRSPAPQRRHYARQARAHRARQPQDAVKK